LLLDGDGRRETLDAVAVRFLHLLEELTGVRGERLDVAPLPLGVERVEGERGLAGAREARDDHEAVARDLDVDVLEVVRAGAADDDAARHRTAASRRARHGPRRPPARRPADTRRAPPASGPRSASPGRAACSRRAR